ncbi:carboxymuconolactone decarboxylase family protein [Legionella nagasakiensis]|uniref:carboxymuconolactone decarboxylase family protein n=1 Tax=Legionella nagasakiensis TaxID=535290 RepID=UPI001055662F|nr:carboxymuconolactone decarboxylase family protein [Legionella nagasakiensis]
MVDYQKISEKTVKYIYTAHASLSESPLNPQLRVLVELRASQINGCAYCCLIHSDEARKLGIEQKKLDQLPAWTEATCFDSKEKLALTWCETVTLLRSDKQKIRTQLSDFFSAREIVDLTLSISLMNALNRIAVSLM